MDAQTEMMPTMDEAATEMPARMFPPVHHHGVRPGYGSKVLGPHDVVGSTFYIACNMMLAFAVFFFLERQSVPKRWQGSVTIAGIVCGIAFYNYVYMKEAWQMTQHSPTVFRYTDWLITVPLQIAEFYFILKACNPGTPNSLGTKLLIMSIIMLLGGWLAETDQLDKVSGFVIGMLGWLYVVYEVTFGQAAALARGTGSKAGQQAFSTIRFIVSVGWTIYPLGYAVAFLIKGSGWAPNSYMVTECWRNAIYNLADLVNKGAFGLAIWAAAKSEGEGLNERLLG